MTTIAYKNVRTPIIPVGDLPMLALFARGEQGAWYDPSDMATLFQDAAGTVPVTAVEQPVGRMLDKSPNGFHATQTTTTARQILSARKNLFAETEAFAASAWTKTATTVDAGNVVRETDASTGHNVRRNFTPLAATTYTFSAELKADGRNRIRLGVPGGSGTVWAAGVNPNADFNLATGAVTLAVNGTTARMTQMQDGYWRLSITATTSATVGLSAFGVTLMSDDGLYVYAGDPTKGMVLRNAQLEISSAPTRYQRVNTLTDYDTVGFPHYLLSDGVDDRIFRDSAALPPIGANHYIVAALAMGIENNSSVFGFYGNGNNLHSIQNFPGNRIQSIYRASGPSGTEITSLVATTGSVQLSVPHVIESQVTADTQSLWTEGFSTSAPRTVFVPPVNTRYLGLVGSNGGIIPRNQFYGGVILWADAGVNRHAVRKFLAEKAGVTLP